ncbi:MAG: hypothetical protein Q4P28_00095 [Tissierellia bacterium]|nr:hypothetical protein [Tissierellia bacterium]
MIKTVFFNMDEMISKMDQQRFKGINQLMNDHNIPMDLENDGNNILWHRDLFIKKIKTISMDNQEKLKVIKEIENYYDTAIPDVLLYDIKHLLKELYRQSYSLIWYSRSQYIPETLFKKSEIDLIFDGIIVKDSLKNFDKDIGSFLDSKNLRFNDIAFITDSYEIFELLANKNATILHFNEKVSYKKDASAYYIDDIRNAKLIIEKINRRRNIFKVRYGTKDYLKSLFLRNQLGRKKKQNFRNNLNDEEKFDVFNFEKDHQLLATALVKPKTHGLLVADYGQQEEVSKEDLMNFINQLMKYYDLKKIYIERNKKTTSKIKQYMDDLELDWSYYED